MRCRTDIIDQNIHHIYIIVPESASAASAAPLTCKTLDMPARKARIRQRVVSIRNSMILEFYNLAKKPRWVREWSARPP